MVNGHGWGWEGHLGQGSQGWLSQGYLGGKLGCIRWRVGDWRRLREYWRRGLGYDNWGWLDLLCMHSVNKGCHSLGATGWYKVEGVVRWDQ